MMLEGNLLQVLRIRMLLTAVYEENSKRAKVREIKAQKNKVWANNILKGVLKGHYYPKNG